MYVRCMCMHVYIQLCKILCMHVYFMYLWMHACIHVGARACVCMYYVCVCARMHVHACVYLCKL